MAAEVDYLLSGGATNTNPQASIGGVKSSTAVVSTNDQNLFANVGTSEAAAGSDKYRCIYISPPTKGYTEMGIWINTPTPSNSSKIYLAVAAEGKNGTAPAIADEDTAPANVVFSRPVADYQKLPLPNLSAGDHIAVWIKRTITAQAQGFDNDYARIVVEGAEV